VRGETVYLKTLRGLKRVHVILRRQDDAYCDPLELRGESALGIPGLLNVARAGRWLSPMRWAAACSASGALMGFLPAICGACSARSCHALGRDLVVRRKAGAGICRENFDDLVIKPAYPTQRMEPVFGNELKGEARAEICAASRPGRMPTSPRKWSTCRRRRPGAAPTNAACSPGRSACAPMP
jgi:uncharacterized circularly permuted ATP-grasp superfamily protein